MTTRRETGGRVRDEAGSPVLKAFEILEALWEGELSETEYEKLTGACGRTLARYVDKINQASRSGPLITKSGGRYRLKRSPDLVELLGGSFDRRTVAALRSTPLGRLVRPKGGLPGRVVDEVRAALDPGQAPRPDDDPSAELLSRVFEALFSGSFLPLDYESEGGARTRLVVPVRLYMDPVQPYLVAWDEERGHLVCLASAKIRSLGPGDGRRMAASTLEELRVYCRSAWGKMIRHDLGRKATARFEAAPAIAPYFQRSPLRLDQVEEDLPDGSLRVELKIHNPKEFVRYALRFGEGLRILGDEEVLAELRGFLSAMAARYAIEEEAGDARA